MRKIAGCPCTRNAGNVLPAMPVSDPDMHHGTCVTHVPWCMSGSQIAISFEIGGGKNVPGIPGPCATRTLTYLVRGPCTYDKPARHHACRGYVLFAFHSKLSLGVLGESVQGKVSIAFCVSILTRWSQLVPLYIFDFCHYYCLDNGLSSVRRKPLSIPMATHGQSDIFGQNWMKINWIQIIETNVLENIVYYFGHFVSSSMICNRILSRARP